MKQFDHYPEVLDVSHIQQILGIGRRQAYQLVSSKMFRTIRIGSRIKIPKDPFISWLMGNMIENN